MVAQPLASLEALSPLLWRGSDTIGTIDCPPKQSSPKEKEERLLWSGSIDVVVAASLVTSEEATPLLLLLVPLQVSCVQSLEPRDPCNSKYLFLGHT